MLACEPLDDELAGDTSGGEQELATETESLEGEQELATETESLTSADEALGDLVDDDGEGVAVHANAFGFAWVNPQGSPDSSYDANTGGGAIIVQNPSTGIYVVTFQGLGGPGGNAQVVGWGTSNTRCKVQSWYQNGSDEQVNVRCHTPAGGLINSGFVVRYGRVSGWTYPSAYLWADQPSAPAYSPSAAYSHNSTGVANTITRAAVGTYTVNLPGLGGTNGNVLVSAHGTSSTHCNVLSWGSSPGNRPIEVRCWSTAGVPADSTFSLAFDGAGITGYNDVGAFAWAHDPTSASYSPSSDYSYDSGLWACGNGGNLAGRLDTGRYFMRHTWVPAFDSTVHVTARSFPAAADYCKIESWIPWTSGVEVKTRCFDSSGSAKDSQYAESYYTTEVVGPC
jgi:hypothetical protein